MITQNDIAEFSHETASALSQGTLVKISFSGYKGKEPDLKSATARPITIKNAVHLSVTYRYKTRDIVKNYGLAEVAQHIQELAGASFNNATLFTTDFDLSLTQKALKRSKPTNKQAPSLSHDKDKNRLIATDGKYLEALSITDSSGRVLKSSQDKYKQINRYVELLSPLLKPGMDKIVDMGSGKGYLTFALYDYLTSKGEAPSVVGVEYRQDMVDLCNKIAANTGFDNLSFSQGTIENFDATGTNVLIALHACDTATDDAIAKGIKADAELIVVAPCCHKQIRREMEKSKNRNDVEFLTRHGIFMERQAEMVTDGMRALILEYFGYSVKVFEFISDAHTPKNVMITAQKKSDKLDVSVLQKIKDAKSYLGISEHHLEKILEI
jgi:SAM-dependent methyltransferase